MGTNPPPGLKGLHVPCDAASVGIPAAFVLAQRLRGHRRQLPRCLCAELEHGRDRMTHHATEHLEGRPHERRSACKNFVQNRPQSPNVGTLIDLVHQSFGLLGTHVLGRPYDIPDNGAPHVRIHDLFYFPCYFLAPDVFLASHLGQAPIQDHGFSKLSHHDV